jgi:hypothetical protein
MDPGFWWMMGVAATSLAWPIGAIAVGVVMYLMLT